QACDGTAAGATAAARRALAHDGRIFAEQPEFFAPGRPVLALLHADELDAAERAAARGLAIARERGATPELVAAWWMSSGVAWARGDLVAAEADVRQWGGPSPPAPPRPPRPPPRPPRPARGCAGPRPSAAAAARARAAAA